MSQNALYPIANQFSSLDTFLADLADSFLGDLHSRGQFADRAFVDAHQTFHFPAFHPAQLYVPVAFHRRRIPQCSGHWKTKRQEGPVMA